MLPHEAHGHWLIVVWATFCQREETGGWMNGFLMAPEGWPRPGASVNSKPTMMSNHPRFSACQVEPAPKRPPAAHPRDHSGTASLRDRREAEMLCRAGEIRSPSSPRRMHLLRPNSQLGLTSAKKSLDNEPSKPGATLPVHGRWPTVRPLLALPPRGSPQTALEHPFSLLPPQRLRQVP